MPSIRLIPASIDMSARRLVRFGATSPRGAPRSIVRIEVAYGIPERTTTDRQFLRVMQATAVTFAEGPDRVHAVLGPVLGQVRWFTFASSAFRPDYRLTERAFVDVLAIQVPELLVATRVDDDAPHRFEVHRERLVFALARARDAIHVSGTLPVEVPLVGAVDEIGLAATSLPIVRPFDLLAEPTHEIVLRQDGARVRRCVVRPLVSSILPVRVRAESRHDSLPG
jgi:hypothetical protein